MTTGDPCGQCAEQGGHMVIYTSKRRTSCVVQYLHCWRCGFKPDANKVIVDSQMIARRKRRGKKPA